MNNKQWTPDLWRQAGSIANHGGHRYFYAHQDREPGADAALLLIHGFPTSSWDWHCIWDALGQRFPRVVAPDMLGFGFSAKPRSRAYTILDQADLHEGLLAQLGIRHVHLLAHDYGDTVAQELLARQLERRRPTGARIESCVLLNGGLFPETHHPRTIQRLLLTPLGPWIGRMMTRASFGRSFAAVFGDGTQPSAQELDEFWELIRLEGGEHVMHELIRYIPERKARRERWVGVLQKTSVPLRLINGPDDPVSGAHMVERYRELVPKPDVVSLRNIGHYPQVEDPDGVLDALDDFHHRLGTYPHPRPAPHAASDPVAQGLA